MLTIHAEPLPPISRSLWPFIARRRNICCKLEIHPVGPLLSVAGADPLDIAQGICRVLSDEARMMGCLRRWIPRANLFPDRVPGRNDASYLHPPSSAGTADTVSSAVLRTTASHFRNVRADTHADNRTMQHLLEENGFLPCGTIHVRDGTPRLAYHWTADRP